MSLQRLPSGARVALLAGVLHLAGVGVAEAYGAFSRSAGPWGARQHLGPFGDRSFGLLDDALGGGDLLDDDYFRPTPCPRYRGVSISPWQEAGRGHAAASVRLPEVEARHRRVWLDEEGGAVRVSGLRPLPPRGRACLPHGARLSADGRAELLEATVPLPPVLDAARLRLREAEGGLTLLAPLRREPAAAAPPTSAAADVAAGRRASAARDQGGAAASAAGARRPAVPQPPQEAPPRSAEAAVRPPRRAPSRTATAAAPTTREVAPRPAAPPSWRAALPPSDGLVVMEEEYPEPVKRQDAAEGWYDNRGDFQFY